MTVVVKGLTEFNRAIAKAEHRDLPVETRLAYRAIGEYVREDAEERFSRYGDTPASKRSHAVSAAGYRVAVRQRGVDVESRLRKTTGKHPEYGSVQMRQGLVPAERANQPKAQRRTEQAMERIVQNIERRSD